MSIEEHQEILLSYMTDIPIDSNRYLICGQLIKDLEIKKYMGEPCTVLSIMPRRCRYKARTFNSIQSAAYSLGLTKNELYYDIVKEKHKHGVYLI